MVTRASIIKLLKRLEENQEMNQFLVDPETVDYTKIDKNDPWFSYGHPWFKEPYFYVDESPLHDAVPSTTLIEFLAEVEMALCEYLFDKDDPQPDYSRVEILEKAGYEVLPRTTIKGTWLMASVRLKKGIYVFR